jgi:LacI family transcriptional regulator
LVQLTRDGLPVVVVNTLGTQIDLPNVTVDNYAGAVTAVNYLLQLGHERVACVQGLMQFQCCQDRYRGYLDALRTAGIQPDPELTKAGEFNPDTARARSRELFALPTGQRPTAVFAQSDVTAYAVMKAAADAGLRIPEDVSVIGFDDVESAAQIHPPLTTIRQPFAEMGSRAAELLIAAVRAGDEPAGGEGADVEQAGGPSAGAAADQVRLEMPTSLIVRSSCGPAPVARERRGRPASTRSS